MVEYMALRRPVVVNDHPDQQKVVNESGGAICVPYKEEPFAQAIISVFEDPKAGGTDDG
jgi:glycosyltransferase involved in cell wall biosynthesis|tara:strand:- start:6232 stop:6408 length:177 start_codon:yes stop_codon:yes gene_type:complete